MRLCLCKDPAERPSCTLLLRHKFWKARACFAQTPFLLLPTGLNSKG